MRIHGELRIRLTESKIIFWFDLKLSLPSPARCAGGLCLRRRDRGDGTDALRACAAGPLLHLRVGVGVAVLPPVARLLRPHRHPIHHEATLPRHYQAAGPTACSLECSDFHFWEKSGVDWNIAGLAAEFRSEKIPRNRLGTASVIPRKIVLIPRHSEVYGKVYSEARNGRKWHEKN